MNLISLLLLELQIWTLPLLLKTFHGCSMHVGQKSKYSFLMRAQPPHLHETYHPPQSVRAWSHFSTVYFQHVSFCVWAYCPPRTFWEVHTHPSTPNSSTFLAKFFLMTSSRCVAPLNTHCTVCTHLYYNTCYPAWTLLLSSSPPWDWAC